MQRVYRKLPTLHRRAQFFSGNDIEISAGGEYTVYAVDATGNASVSSIYINTYPSVESIDHQTLEEDVSATLYFAVSDSETAISRFRYHSIRLGKCY